MNPAATGREHLAARAFVSLADTLVDEYDVIDLLDRLVGYSVELLAADAAGIVFADARGELRAVAASGEDAQLVELLQLHSDEGPCLDCVRSGSGHRHRPDRRRCGRPMACLRRRGRRQQRVPLGPCAASAAARGGDQRAEPVSPSARIASLADLALGQALADVATIGILSERAVRHGAIVNEQLQTARAVINR